MATGWVNCTKKHVSIGTRRYDPFARTARFAKAEGAKRARVTRAVNMAERVSLVRKECGLKRAKGALVSDEAGNDER